MPLFVMAIEYVKNEKVEDYKLLSKQVDEAVRSTEPGMLVHALSELSANETGRVFGWLEVYDDHQSLAMHFQNEPVKRHTEGWRRLFL